MKWLPEDVVMVVLASVFPLLVIMLIVLILVTGGHL